MIHGSLEWLKTAQDTIPIMINTSKRILHEIKEVQSEAMRKNRIFYWFNEADVKKGRALIIGPEGTPYADCPLIFDVQLPADYPLSSPRVNFVTSDGSTRFHPNLYVTGKVCLSILGTWKGPAWTAAITLSKMLLTIQSLLEENPIVNEPTYETVKLTDPRAANYTAFIESRLLSLSFRDLLRLKRGACPPVWEEFKDVLCELQDELLSKLNVKVQAHTEDKTYTGLIYSMSGTTDWLLLKEMALAASL
jgi:ubiquitin-protein ligase